MSNTNTTSHYGLPQYVGSDKPKYLTDFNETMATIDDQMYANETAAATADSKADAAQSTADANTSSISALDSQINGDSGLAADVAANQGAITTINSLIGNGTPTTTDKTLIGAINELHTDVQAVDAKADAINTKLSNKMVLDSEAVQVSVTADGVKTFNQLISELHASLGAAITALPDNVSAHVESFLSSSLGYLFTVQDLYLESAPSNVQFVRTVAAASTLTVKTLNASATPSFYEANVASGTYTDLGATVPANNEQLTVYYRKCYKV